MIKTASLILACLLATGCALDVGEPVLHVGEPSDPAPSPEPTTPDPKTQCETSAKYQACVMAEGAVSSCSDKACHCNVATAAGTSFAVCGLSP